MSQSPPTQLERDYKYVGWGHGVFWFFICFYGFFWVFQAMGEWELVKVEIGFVWSI
jgi:hypothetical protein